MTLHRFYNGGIVFSTIVLCFIAMISLYSFLLLVETRLAVHGSFGGSLARRSPGRGSLILGLQISEACSTESICAG